MSYTSNSEQDTEEIAANFADALSSGDTVMLNGDLGAGKSVFARALIRALSGDKGLIVPSPTYTLVESYDTHKGPVNHFDLYRLQSPDEIHDLGWDDMIGQSICIIEWPERLEHYTPQSYIDMTITKDGETTRRITINKMDKKG